MSPAPLIPVILSGGRGSRLWPMSRPEHPKQFQTLAGPRSMLAETVLRVTGDGFQAPVAVCNQEHRFATAETLSAIGVVPQAMILEPQGRGTAPAVAAAALATLDHHPDGLLLVMPSDHVIHDQTAFHKAVAHAAEVAAHGALVTFGITPDRPETGYGYIQAGRPFPGVPDAFHVAAFHEKPDPETAAAYVAAGGYTWNSGLFVLPARLLLDEMQALCPDVLTATRHAWTQRRTDPDFIRLDEQAFSAAPQLSLDVAVMEKTKRAAVLPVAMGWSDIGSWAALWEATEQDAHGNVLIGDVLAWETTGSYLRADSGQILAVDGLRDAVVVVTDDAVLVTTRDRAQRVGQFPDRLARRDRKTAT